MRRAKELRILQKAIKPYGLTIIDTNKHRKILNAEGNRVYSMSSSPSCQFFARNTLHDLIKSGHVPKGTHL